ncbi:MAG: ABC transporter permease [Gemmatimonadota bacterium]|nr:MAG: ABC transporter permease [Gemmatimonadota bacterium]
MSIAEALRVALSQIWAHKLKSLFSLIGVVIGITFLIAVITVVEGMNRYVQEDFAGSLFGVNSFSIVQRPTVQTGNYSAEELRRLARNRDVDLDDVEAVRRAVPDARYIAWRNASRMDEVWYGERRRRNIRVIGGSEQYQAIQGWEIDRGRGLTPLDQQRALKVAVIGPAIAEKLFPNGAALGKRIRLQAHRFEVVGVFERKGGLFGNAWDAAVLVPYETFNQTLSTKRDRVREISVKANNQREMLAAMDAVEEALRIRRGLRPGEENDFHFQTSSGLLSAWETINNILLAAVPGLVSVSLVVGGIVIMNIMLVSVTQRTREIGVRKAMGARQRDIMLQFLAESSIVSLVGAALGIGLGLGLGKLVERLSPLPASIPPWALAMAIGLGLLVGLSSGIYPARRASRLNPIDALRYE